MTSHIYYVLTYPDGKFVALDSASGGYPYPTNSFREAHLWRDIPTAMNYPAGDEDFGLAEVTMTAVQIEKPRKPLNDDELIEALLRFTTMHEAAIDDHEDEYRFVLEQARERIGKS